MSRRDAFVEHRQERWRELETLMSRPILRTGEEWSRLAALYRAVCADLAAAGSATLSPDVQRYLDDLAARAHNRLYSARAGGRWRVLELLFVDFPREIRQQWVLFAVASALFYLPFLVGFVGALGVDGFAQSVLPEAMLQQMEDAYTGKVVGRGAGEDAAMAGFYVWNNVGIALRCFATGALAGLGSIYYLVYNGLVLGTMQGWIWTAGGGYNLTTFTAGHSAWELTGIVVSGTGGLRLGLAVVVTDGRTRAASLRHAAPGLFRLVIGAATMLLVAATIEAFWSASPVPPPVKWAFGVLGVVIVAVWLLLGGRGRR